jgi:hypothetical protein
MMMSKTRDSVNKMILNEIDAIVSDPVIREVAREILEFEIQNWNMQRPHSKEFLDKLIEMYVAKRRPP